MFQPAYKTSLPLSIVRCHRHRPKRPCSVARAIVLCAARAWRSRIARTPWQPHRSHTTERSPAIQLTGTPHRGTLSASLRCAPCKRHSPHLARRLYALLRARRGLKQHGLFAPRARRLLLLLLEPHLFLPPGLLCSDLQFVSKVFGAHLVQRHTGGTRHGRARRIRE